MGLRAASRESTKSITATMDGSPFTADVYLGAGAQTGRGKPICSAALGAVVALCLRLM